MSENSVNKGFQFEEQITKLLNSCGLKAVRTNKTNEYDPDNYKHGFDGGVDIIATFDTVGRYERHFEFYIQCKCRKEDLTKSAISEVYGGMHARKATGDSCVPVVVAAGDASQETRQFAKDLGVELFLFKEAEIIINARAKIKIPYDNYGKLLKAMLYGVTKDDVWLQTLPENTNRLTKLTQNDQIMIATVADYNCAQSYLDSAEYHDRRAREDRQKALDIQKMIVYRTLEMGNLLNASKEKDTPTIDMDDG